MRVTAIILAAGKGARLKSSVPKPLFKFDSKPAIIYSLEVFQDLRCIDEIIVVVNRENKIRIIKTIEQYRIKKVKNVVIGGSRRQDSVARGLESAGDQTDLVLLHDAARPFIDRKTAASAIKRAGIVGAAVVGVPVKATIKKSRTRGPKDKRVLVGGTIARENLWEIQTPQIFRKDWITVAYKKFGESPVTDDAMLIEKLGKKIEIVRGSYYNIKITSPEDLVTAEAITKRFKKQKRKKHV